MTLPDAATRPGRPPADPADVPPELLEGLNPAQRDAVLTLSGPLLVVAGPGSGKTRVLTRRIAALLATGTWSSRILAVTFTNKAAAEMRERIAALVGDEPVRRMWVATFHSACVRILRLYHAEAGLPRSFSIADTSDARRVLARCADELGMLAGLAPGESKSLLKDAASVISRTKNDGKTYNDLATSPFADVREYAPLMASYDARLAQIGAVDFDDILLRVLDLLRHNRDVRTALRQRFEHVLVDEFQDTNAVQDEICRTLAAAGNLCVVGDADQSIYAFRGAKPSVMDAFPTTWPGAKVVVLEENYRSTQAICEVSRAVIAPNPARHRAVLQTSNAAGDPVRVYAAADNQGEASWVCQQIQARGGAWSDHAVLVRTNFLTRSLEQELTRRNIPYQVVGALRFYDRAEVKDALAYLRFATNPADQIAFARCVNTPKRGVGETTVESILTEAAASRRTVLDVVAERATGKGRGVAGLAAFVEVIAQVIDAAERGPAEALRVVADAAGLREYLHAQAAKEGLDREGNLDELIAFAVDFLTCGAAATDPEGRDLASLTGWEQTLAFLENVALVSAAETPNGQDPQEDQDTVALLTMHAAKGKEYPHVYVVGLEENVLPHARAVKDPAPDALAEERRLLFVAVSRAQQTLDLSYCRSRFQFGKDVSNDPSRFLNDLPDSVVRLDAVAAAYRGPGSPQGGWRSGPARQPTGPRTATVGPSLAPRRTAGPRLGPGEAVVGTRVRHEMFGEGTLTEVTATTVTVDFSGQARKLALAVAPLTRIA